MVPWREFARQALRKPQVMAPEWLPAGLAGGSGGSGQGGAKKPGVITAIRGRVGETTAQMGEARATASGADTCCPNMTLEQRVHGCLGSMVIGFAISFLSFATWHGAHTYPNSMPMYPPHGR